MLEKALVTMLDGDVRISVPISKIDESKRLVSGFATLDNVDQHADVVTANASRKAFAEFRGNVREQHETSLAVGKVANFTQQDFFHEPTNKLYNGMWVDVYVSKGAPNTWEKVLDGTLSGFSVKGDITQEHSEYVPDLGKIVRFIDGYKLTELSLVDSPGNELCNVMSIAKMDDGSTKVNLAVETIIENVFWCETDQIAVVSNTETELCRICKNEMVSAGWFESMPNENKIEKIRDILSSYGLLQKDSNATEGGTDMSNEEKNVVEEGTATSEQEVVETAQETPAEEEVQTENEAGEENGEQSQEEPTVEDVTDMNNFAQALDEIRASLSRLAEKSDDKPWEVPVAEIRETVVSVEKSVDSKLEQLQKDLSAVSAEFSKMRNDLGGVEKRLDTYESSNGFKKSADIDTSGTFNKQGIKPKSIWSGSFLPQEELD